MELNQNNIILSIIIYLAWLISGSGICTILAFFSKELNLILYRRSFMGFWLVSSLGPLNILLPLIITFLPTKENILIRTALYKKGDKIKIKENSINKLSNRGYGYVLKNREFTISKTELINNSIHYSTDAYTFWEGDIEKIINRKDRINKLKL